MKTRNWVARHLRQFNKSARRQVDRKKQEKSSPKNKHKNKVYDDE
jgi:hypothetical protein